MSDRVKLAREIAARTKPRFIEIKREPRVSRSTPARQREKLKAVPFTEEQLNEIRGGLTAEEYRWNLIREWCED
jgi:hypothetical protein